MSGGIDITLPEQYTVEVCIYCRQAKVKHNNGRSWPAVCVPCATEHKLGLPGQQVGEETVGAVAPEKPGSEIVDASTPEGEAFLRIRARANQLTEAWTEQKTSLRAIAVQYADLENDLAHVNDLSHFTAIRYHQVMEILPSAEDLKGWAAQAEEDLSENDGDLRKVQGEHIRKLRLLASVVEKYHAISHGSDITVTTYGKKPEDQ